MDWTSTWTIENNSPEGYEPNYSIIDKTIGREIGVNLEKDEAVLLLHSYEMYNIIKENRELMESLYQGYKYDDKELLDNVNNNITKMDKLLFNIKKEL